MDRRKLFVAGNGPSLRDIKFEALRGIDWLGMNAAYRYWDDVGIYPTIYCCLDKVVVKSHALAIQRLIESRRIKWFFLVRDILELVPSISDYEYVLFLEDLVEQSGPEAEIFKTNFSDKKTTGSWAVRFAIYLGYREIYLGGIDCNYVEVIKEADRTGIGLELKINSHVESNPNYFFSSYQKPGDVYQVPNPERHFGNLHLQTFEALNVDISRLGLDVSIRNTAIRSQLHCYGVYDYVAPSVALGYACLEAVVVPLTRTECDKLIRNLKILDLPAFMPLRLDSVLVGRIALHLFFDCEYSQEIVSRLESYWEKSRFLRIIFGSIKVTFLGIPDELNFYIKDASAVDRPRKMGPNVQFLAMMNECREYQYVFLMETDCIPAKANWLSDLESECRSASRCWIAGSHLNALHDVDPAFAMQINGNALYATGEASFRAFLDKVFVPALFYLVFEKGSTSLAYDCLISKVWTYGINSRERRDAKKGSDPVLMRFFQVIQDNLDKFRPTPLIKNISHVETDMQLDQLMELLDAGHAVVHSKRLAQALSEAYERFETEFELEFGEAALARRFGDTFIKLADKEPFAYHYYSNLDGFVFERFDPTTRVNLLCVKDSAAVLDQEINRGAYVLFSVNDVKIGEALECQLDLVGSTDQVVIVKFSRHGEGRFSEDRREVRLRRGERTHISLSFTCLDRYTNARLFVKPVRGESGRLRVGYLVGRTGRQCVPNCVTLIAPAESRKLVYRAFLNRVAPTAFFTTDRVDADEGQVGGGILKGVSGGILSDDGGKRYPRLLMIDSTPVRHCSATGQIKKTLLGDWPAESFLQVWEGGGNTASLHALELTQSIDASRRKAFGIDGLLQLCRNFNPEVVYFRPVDSALLFQFARSVMSELRAPLALHIMDDWPERLRFTNPDRYEALDRELRTMIRYAAIRLSISDAMSCAYSKRYGGDWIALANGVNLSEFPIGIRSNAPSDGGRQVFVLRYMGGLADDMNFASVADVARAVSAVGRNYRLRFEIYTMPWYKAKAEKELGCFEGVMVFDLVPPEKYAETLCSANALLLAYNFDAESLRYVGLSLANKMPECLASGVPLLAYGPEAAATIGYLKRAECAEVVTVRDHGTLCNVIDRLARNHARRSELSERARRYVAENLTSDRVQVAFFSAMSGAASLGRSVGTKGEAAASARTYVPSAQLGRTNGVDDGRSGRHGCGAVDMVRVDREDANGFRTANVLYRSGDYLNALKIYISLFEERPLSVYRQNALMCARRLGWLSGRQDERQYDEIMARLV